MASTSATPIVRLPVNDPTSFGTYLDMGVGGILAPLVKTPDEVHAGARACRYPPVGNRGYGPERAARYGFDTDYFAEANDQVLYMVIIETAEAVDAIDDIMAVEGLDGYFVGAYDLTVSLGVPLQFDHPKYLAAEEKVLEAARKAGVPPSLTMEPDAGAEGFGMAIEQGYRLLLVSGDVWMLEAAARNVVGFSQAKSAAAG